MTYKTETPYITREYVLSRDAQGRVGFFDPKNPTRPITDSSQASTLEKKLKEKLGDDNVAIRKIQNNIIVMLTGEENKILELKGKYMLE